jgi:glyoxylase-like metal-dependent hydrolase (beta-lactamase superfamily II)
MTETLQVDVYVAPAIPAVTGSTDPKKSVWSPISCTLIHGPNSAVIVDTPISVSETEKLAEWIEQTIPGKTLEYIFVTHAHGDHFLGAPVLLAKFPSAKFVASSKVAEGCKAQISPAVLDGLWSKVFPGNQLAPNQVAPTALPSSGKFTIDGHELHAIDVEHADTHANSFLHVESLKLVVGGDIVYGDCYQYLAEANTKEKRHQWIAALDQIAALDPHIVVPGHKRATQVNGSYLIEATKKYIYDFEEELERAKDAVELEEAMTKRYPQRWNEYILMSSCQSSFAMRG